MNEEDVQKALLKGARTAVRRAFKWSAGTLWPGDTGAENLIQVSIAEALFQEGTGPRPAIFLEPTLNVIDSQAFPGDTRRVDIGLLRAGSMNYFSVIEIKKHPVSYAEDLRKICQILDRVSTVRYAYLVTYFQKHDPLRNLKRSMADQMSAAAEQIRAEVRKGYGRDCVSLPPKKLHSIEDEAGHWHAAAMVTRFSTAA